DVRLRLRDYEGAIGSATRALAIAPDSVRASRIIAIARQAMAATPGGQPSGAERVDGIPAAPRAQ
ncbi:MAG TPA: hypothetical protein VFS05_03700, partial [Gemmatimonadaceae bacterium]|nr:hypothetical protein [Gemmatimonadaceae bacterium]